MRGQIVGKAEWNINKDIQMPTRNTLNERDGRGEEKMGGKEEREETERGKGK